MRRAPIILVVATLAGGGPSAALPADEATASLTRRQAVEEALARNPAVEAARQQVEQARARVSEAKALPDPTFEATLDGESGFLSPGSSPSRQFGLGFTIPFPTKLKLSGDVARSDLHSAEHALTQLQHEIAAQAVQAYDALLVAEQHLGDLREARSIAQDFVKKTEARFQAGTVPRLDVIKAKVDLAQAENALIANERDLATARAALNRVLGRAPRIPGGGLGQAGGPPAAPRSRHPGALGGGRPTRSSRSRRRAGRGPVGLTPRPAVLAARREREPPARHEPRRAHLLLDGALGQPSALLLAAPQGRGRRGRPPGAGARGDAAGSRGPGRPGGPHRPTPAPTPRSGSRPTCGTSCCPRPGRPTASRR